MVLLRLHLVTLLFKRAQLQLHGCLWLLGAMAEPLARAGLSRQGAGGPNVELLMY